MKLNSRVEAGRNLANTLTINKWENAVVLALPRGGVPVAAEIAKELQLPLEILFVKRIVSQDYPDVVLGALAEFDKPLWNSEAIEQIKIDPQELATLAAQTQKHIFEQQQMWRKKDEPIAVSGKTVILVDDGICTGLTMHAAVDFVRQNGAKEVVIAVPVATKAVKESFTYKVTEFISLHTTETFHSISQFYVDYTKVTDDEVTQIVTDERKARRGFAGSFFSTSIP